MTQRTLLDIASRDVVTAQPDTNGQTLARQMRAEGVGSVVVVTDGYPIGIVTDRDLTVELLAEGEDGTSAVARELMNGFPATVRADVGIHEAVRKMDAENIRRLPVVDAGDTLTGIVTLDDIYRELTAEHDHLRNVIAAESPE
jgi:CBS domain-containing protein